MTKTTNWTAFEARDTKCREFKAEKKKSDWAKGVPQRLIDDNNDVIARLRKERGLC